MKILICLIIFLILDFIKCYTYSRNSTVHSYMALTKNGLQRYANTYRTFNKQAIGTQNENRWKDAQNALQVSETKAVVFTKGPTYLLDLRDGSRQVLTNKNWQEARHVLLLKNSTVYISDPKGKFLLNPVNGDVENLVSYGFEEAINVEYMSVMNGQFEYQVVFSTRAGTYVDGERVFYVFEKSGLYSYLWSFDGYRFKGNYKRKIGDFDWQNLVIGQVIRQGMECFLHTNNGVYWVSLENGAYSKLDNENLGNSIAMFQGGNFKGSVPPLSGGVWKKLSASIVNPIGTFKQTVEFSEGVSNESSSSVSNTVQLDFSTTITAGADYKIFSASTSTTFSGSFGVSLSQTQTTGFNKYIQSSRSIEIPPGQTVYTWQYVLQGQGLYDGLKIDTPIFADTSDNNPPPL